MTHDRNAENQQDAREWQSNPDLHDEFTSLDTYAAYRRAVASGRARVSAQKVPTVNQNTHTHDSPLSVTLRVPGYVPTSTLYPAPDGTSGSLFSHQVPMHVLNIARDLRANNRQLGRTQLGELIAAKAGVSLDVAICAGGMAAGNYRKRAVA